MKRLVLFLRTDFGAFVVHEDVDIKLWAVFGVQLFCDLQTQSNRSQPLEDLVNFLGIGLGLFKKAEELYGTLLGVEFDPMRVVQRGYTVLICLHPDRLDYEVEEMGHTSYPNLNKCYLMSQHPILCGILMHTARLMMQEYGIAVETCTKTIRNISHLYNACSTQDLIKARWFDLEHCMTELQGPNLFMSGKPPGKETQNGYGKAFLFAAGAMSLAYTAPDCRDRKGRRGRQLTEEPLKSRKNNPGKVLRKLGPVSLMFEDRFCRAGDRYDLNEDDLQAITERAEVYKDSGKGKHFAGAKPKTKQSKSVAQLLSDLSLGLDQEVVLISFPYISLNMECTKVLWKLEAQLRTKHRELLDAEDMLPSFGVISLHLLARHSDKLWIAADEIHKHIGDRTPAAASGSAGAAWMVDSIRKPLGTAMQEKIRGSPEQRSHDLQEDTSVRVNSAEDSLVFEQQQDARQEPECVEESDGRAVPETTAAAGGKEPQLTPALVPLD